jgi:hypothetical protein
MAMTTLTWWKTLFGRRPTRRGEVPTRRARRLRLELLEGRQAPATLMVNSTAGTASSSDHYLSLREAVAIVNSGTPPSGLTSQIPARISGGRGLPDRGPGQRDVERGL